MSADAQEKYQATLDNAKEGWNKFKENIERYDTLITEDIPGLEADIRAALDQQIEIKLEAFEYEIQIRLDMSEAMRDWNEFKAKIIDGIKELIKDTIVTEEIIKENTPESIELTTSTEDLINDKKGVDEVAPQKTVTEKKTKVSKINNKKHDKY